MDVVLNSHIALLVLGYLYEEKLDNVSKFFCKFSPYLDEEYQIIKKGLRPVIINSENLSTIVREHCYIKSKVNEIIGTFPSNINAAFDRQTLSGKINHLLKIVRKTVSAPEENNLKRNRTEALSSSEKSSGTNASHIENLPGYCTHKKRRVADSYMFVRNDFSEDSESEEETFNNMINEQMAFGDEKFESESTNFNENLSNFTRKNKKPTQPTKDPKQNTNENSDNIIHNIISVTERESGRESSFNDIVNEDNLIISSKKFCNRIKRTKKENIKSTSLGISKELYMNKAAKLNMSQPEICPQLSSAVETLNNNLKEPDACNKSSIFKIRSGTEFNSTGSIPETDTNFSGSKILFMNSCDFVEVPAHLQTFSPCKNDQVLLDLNGVQTFPILMGSDGSMYVNSNLIQNDRQINNMNISTIESSQSNFENVNVTNTSSKADLEKILNTTSKESIKGNTISITSKENVLSPSNINFTDDGKDSKNSSSLQCKILRDKQTPECNLNSVNKPTNKSLSTPRRKNSHVRVLNFSPLKNFQILNKKVFLQNFPQPEKPLEKKIQKSNLNVNIETNSVVDSNSIVENESSNSTDVTGDQTNVTVIQRKYSSNDDTPKRKTCIISCKRNISRSTSAEILEKDYTEKTNSISLNKTESKCVGLKKINKKMNEKKIIQSHVSISDTDTKALEIINFNNSKSIDPMEEWKEIREKSKDPNFDQFLREIHSKTPTADSHIQKRKLRKKIGSKSAKNLMHSPCTSKQSLKNTENLEKTERMCLKKIENSNRAKKCKITKKVLREKKSKNLEPKTNFLNFRIKTPLKNSSNDVKSVTNKRNCKSSINNRYNKSKDIYDTGKQPICIETSADAPDQSDKEISNTIAVKSIENFKTPSLTIQQNLNGSMQNKKLDENCNSHKLNKEREKRTANIAHILDTPFKLDENIIIPTTPGILLSNVTNLSMNNTTTPVAKLTFSSFCTLKDTEIRTPAFAITPGGHLTHSADKETPKSNVITDYSSGGSYYRPDDSGDNKKLDLELNSKFDEYKQALTQTGQEVILDSTITNEKISETDKFVKGSASYTNIQSKSYDPIVTEIIPCPVVLEKVKSFAEDLPNVVPHYKFIEAGLPDITDESTTSSSSDESSTSSSKSSTQHKIDNKISYIKKMPPISLLSNIDSSEDEDWEVQSTSKNKTLMEENSQLVSNDGEVRFPVRSWITPKKIEKNLSVPKNEVEILDNIKLSSHKKESDKNIELSAKLDRVKAKLNQGTKCEIKETALKKEVKDITKIKEVPKTLLDKNKCETNDGQLDVLAALNLSAKKRTINPQVISTDNKFELSNKKHISSQADDNATSDLFTLRMEEESVSNDSLEVRNAALTLTKMKTKKIGEGNRYPLQLISKSNKKKQPKKNEAKEKNIDSQKSDRIGGLIKSSLDLTEENAFKVKKANMEGTASNKKLDGNCVQQQIQKQIPKLPLIGMKSNILNVNATKKESNLETIPILLQEHYNIINDKISNDEQMIAKNLVLKQPDKDIDVKKKIVTLNKLKSEKLYTNSESESENEDPYDECELFLSEENNKNIKYFIYEENPKNFVPNFNREFDISKIAMKITINDQIRKIDCSEEFKLYSLKPNLEVNKITDEISKKRLKSNKIKRDEIQRKIKPLLENKKKANITIIDNLEEPLNRSTPLLRKIRITHRNKFNNNLEVAKKKQSSESSKTVMKTLNDKNRNDVKKTGLSSTQNLVGSMRTSSQESLSKQNIRNEDINAVLSHLYGNGK